MIDASKQDSLRTLRTDSEDARVLRTRRKLIDAYRRLSDADPGAAISVTAIVHEAGVTRSSFYAHFSDATELAALALTEFQEAAAAFARAAVRAGGSKTAVNSRALLDILSFLDARRRTYRALLSEGSFVDAVTAMFITQILATLRTRESVRSDPEVTAHYLAGGLMRVLVWWLDQDTPLSPEELLRSMIPLTPPDFID